VSTGRARAAIVVGAVAVGSALAGVAIERVTTHHHGPRRGPPGGVASPAQDARRRQEMLDRMSRDLGLRPEQRAGIDSIMQRTDSALRAVRSEMQPRVTTILDRSRDEIGARLDSTQRAKYAEQMAKRRRR
jgi:hypothetical protein